MSANWRTKSLVPLFIEKTSSHLNKIFQCPLSPPAWPLVPRTRASMCTQAIRCHHGQSAGKSRRTPWPAQSCWPLSPAEEGTTGPPLQWSFSSSAYKLFFQEPVGTYHLQHCCQICSILACLLQKVGGGGAGQLIDSVLEQTSFTSQMVCAGVMQLVGEAVFTATLYRFFIFLYLFSGIHLQRLWDLWSDDVFEQKDELSVGGINIWPILSIIVDWGERVFFSVTAIFLLHLRMFPLSQCFFLFGLLEKKIKNGEMWLWNNSKERNSFRFGWLLDFFALWYRWSHLWR